MTSQRPEHPVSALSQEEKYRIYYSRVVDLAVYSSLLTPDPSTEIGYFAFSRYYEEGKALDHDLGRALREFEEKYPEELQERRASLNIQLVGAIDEYFRSDNADKLRDLIRVGASYRVWPVGTSFTLTYPWDLSGHGRSVRFRDDLTPFMKRRILEILKNAGKLRNSKLFPDLGKDRQG
jgi:hypothetical protein